MTLWALVWLLAAPPVSAREQQRVLETPVVQAPLSPALEASPAALLPTAVDAPATAPDSPAAVPALPRSDAVAGEAAAGPAAFAASPRPHAAADGERDGADWAAGSERFDHARDAKDSRDTANLYALARKATPEDRKQARKVLEAVGHGTIYVDNNVLSYAAHGDPRWLYFFYEADKAVRVVPQVRSEFEVDPNAVRRASADDLRRTRSQFERYLGKRVRQVSPEKRRAAALTEFLTAAQLSLPDAKVIAEVAASCSDGCYLVSADGRLANAVSSLDSPGNRKALRDFVQRRREQDPSFPEPRWPKVLKVAGDSRRPAARSH